MPRAGPSAIVAANLPSLWALRSAEPYFIHFQPFSFSNEGVCEGHSSGQFLVGVRGGDITMTNGVNMMLVFAC